MTTTPKLDAAKFRSHYYRKPRISDWGERFANLKFGIELEYIVHASHDVNQLLRHDDYFKFVDALIDKGYSKKFDAEGTGRISKNVEQGYIKICPDFAYHILELSLPPFQDITTLIEEYGRVLFEVDTALSELGYRRGGGSYTDISGPFDIVVEERLKGSIETFQSSVKPNVFGSACMAAQISSTHIHFNAGTEHALRYLPALYDAEWIAQRLFTRPVNIDGRQIPSVRPLLYQDTFGPNYHLVNIPPEIPTTVDAYVSLFNESQPLFPNDKFFPARDFSVIRPTPYGTLEFRSADTVPSSEALSELVAFRLMQLKYAIDHGDSNSRAKGEARSRYIEFASQQRVTLNDTEKLTLEKLISIDTSEFQAIGIEQAIFDRLKEHLERMAQDRAVGPEVLQRT